MAHPGGRPSKYDPRYCAEMVEFCRRRHSITGFAGKIGVGRETLAEWGRVHPEFSVALNAAKAAATLGYEESVGTIPPAISIFGMKNMAPDDYKADQHLVLTGINNGPIKTENVVYSGVLAEEDKTI